MADYKVKISANLDMSEAEKKLDDFTNKKHKLNIDANDAKENVDSITNTISKAQKSTQSFGDAFKKSLNFGSAAMFVRKTFQEISVAAGKAKEAIKDIDGSIKDLRMATNGNYADTLELVKGYNKIGQQIGATTTEVTDSANSFLRQGKSISETNELIRDSMILSKTAGINSADATKYLTSAMKGYKVAAQDAIGIVDKLLATDLISATDAGGLAEGMSKTAVSANMAGVEMETLIGYLATVGEVTQESMSTVGNSFKTMFARFSDIKAGKLKLIDEDGTTETLSDVEQALKNVGINIRSTITDFDDFDDALASLAAKWDTLNSTQQNAIAKAFGGTRQKERFLVLMENYDNAQKYAQAAADSAGIAEQKFSAYADSIEAKSKSLQAAFESLSVNTFSTSVYGDIIQATTALVTFLDKTNLVKGTLAGLATAGAVKTFTILATGIANAAMQMDRFDSALAIIKAGNIGKSQLDQIITLTNNLSNSQLRAVVSANAFNNEQRKAILMAHGLSAAEAESTLSTMGLASAEGAAAASTTTLSGALKGLWATLMANPLFLVATTVSAAVIGIQLYNQKIQEQVDKAREAGNSWSETNSSFNSQIAKIRELKTSLDSGTLSEEEAYNAKSNLYSIQQSLIGTYGSQASGIDLVNGKLEEQIDLIRALSAEQANQFLNENLTGIQKAENEMTKNRKLKVGRIQSAVGDSGEKALLGIVRKYRDYITSELNSRGEIETFYFNGNAENAKEVLNSFVTDLRNAYSEFSDSNLLKGFINDTSASLNAANDVLSEYQGIYKQAQQARLVEDKKLYSFGDTKQTAVEWMNDYTRRTIF